MIRKKPIKYIFHDNEQISLVSRLVQAVIEDDGRKYLEELLHSMVKTSKINWSYIEPVERLAKQYGYSKEFDKAFSDKKYLGSYLTKLEKTHG